MQLYHRPTTPEFRQYVKDAIAEGRGIFGLDLAPCPLVAEQLRVELDQSVSDRDAGKVLRAIGIPRRTYYGCGVTSSKVTVMTPILRNYEYWSAARARDVHAYVRAIPRLLAEQATVTREIPPGLVLGGPGAAGIPDFLR
jgi:hypothetical protein